MQPNNKAPEGADSDLSRSAIEQIANYAADKLSMLAMAGAVGVLAAGSCALLEQSNAALKASPVQANGKKHPDENGAKAKTRPPRTDCSTYRVAANDIYAGSGCAKEGATAETVGDGHIEKGWVYSAIVSRGVKKCFFVQRHKFPKPKRSDPLHVASCEGYFINLVMNKYAYLRKYNCRFLPPRTNHPAELPLQGCRSGTTYPYTPIVSKCTKNVVFRNYATADPSPWNADGKARAGFSEEVISSKGREKVSYRVEIKDKPRNGRKGGAAVIRGVSKRHGWGLMYPDCPDQSQLRGGTPTR